MTDPVNLRVRRIVREGIERAYDVKRPDDHDHADACETCGGDGCHACFWTGQQSKVRL